LPSDSTADEYTFTRGRYVDIYTFTRGRYVTGATEMNRTGDASTHSPEGVMCLVQYGNV